MFTDYVETVVGHLMARPSPGVFDVALFEENVWWTQEAVDRLVGQTTTLKDEATNMAAPYRITKAWKHDGLVVVRLEPDA